MCKFSFVEGPQKEGKTVKSQIAGALGLGILIGFAMAMAFDTPGPTWSKPRPRPNVALVPWAPDSAAVAKQHKSSKKKYYVVYDASVRSLDTASPIVQSTVANPTA